MDQGRSLHWRENAPLYGVLAVLVLAFAGLMLLGATRPAPSPANTATQATATPPTPLSALPATGEDEAVIASALDPDDAQAKNAAVPFVADRLAPARSFVFAGNAADRSRALDCLALAGMAEAGDDPAGQRAVMQVVLNRVRHPAFANTICGVVFEGSQRPTGCQFSFTCDGSLARRYPAAMRAAAMGRAEEALGGRVDPTVGTATHFHADYVYPVWSSQLDKLAVVGPHLFFVWRGYWGTGAALNQRYRGGEPDPLGLSTAALAIERPADLVPSFGESGQAVRTITAPLASEVAKGDTSAATLPAGSSAQPAPGVHLVMLSDGDRPAALIDKARALCPGSRYCQVYGWSAGDDIPAKLPLSPAARSTLRFSFTAARDGNPEVAYFDCRLWPTPAPGQCLPRARQ
ncbi:MAG: cell wall hydrolase [Sphingomonadales bacterium]|nr:cell wall hydrolase [Sphingomonadales bacterium]MBD3775170.1 cell wall hydrolase [Paracoccaceae bacterium]